MLEQIRLFVDKKHYQEKHMITGVQGIGKSYSLLLMAHCFKYTEAIRQNFHVVMISECSLLSEKKWSFVVKQFKLAFPDDPLFSEESTLKKENLEKLVEKYSKAGKILVLIVDQINWLYGDGDQILGDLLSFNWTIKIVSESANNNVPANKRYETYVWHMYTKMISENSIIPILTRELAGKGIPETDLEKITNITRGIPRESLLLCLTEGNSLEEKISKYEYNRKKDLWSIHQKFIETLKALAHGELLKSIFYMDSEAFIQFPHFPVINQQLMTVETGINDHYKISSILPFVRTFLMKEFYNEETFCKIDENFYSTRRKELISILIDSKTESRTRGIYFEEFTLLRFSQSYIKKEEIGLLFHPVVYLNEHDEINYSVLI